MSTGLKAGAAFGAVSAAGANAEAPNETGALLSDLARSGRLAGTAPSYGGLEQNLGERNGFDANARRAQKMRREAGTLAQR